MGVKSHANVRIVIQAERPSLKTPRQAMFQTIEWTPDGTVRLIDQRRLPLEEVYIECRDVAAVADAIRTMQIRGAPALGGAGAVPPPPAVNLAGGIDGMKRGAEKSKALPIPAIVQALIREAQAIREEDIRGNRAMGEHGKGFIADGAAVLTHCNPGALATAGYGTALGVIRAAVEAGKRVRVVATETRPLLQGARLTAWELARGGSGRAPDGGS